MNIHFDQNLLTVYLESNRILFQFENPDLVSPDQL